MQLLAQRLAAADPAAAAFCRTLAATPPAEEPSADDAYTVAVSTCLAYATPEPRLHGYTAGAFDGVRGTAAAWDDGAAWFPWAEQPDPITALHIDVAWALVPLQV